MMSSTRAPKTPRMRGSNAAGMREFNERTLLQAVRLHGPIPKADLARLTQLSTQTVGLIVERLLDDELLQKGERVRGKIGQPSVPLSLNADGAYGLGLQVGRRSLELLIADFCGQMRWSWRADYDHPDPEVVLPKMREGLIAAQAAWGQDWVRVVGVGLAAPLGMHQWSDVMGAQAAPALARWADVDLVQELRRHTDLPVAFAKDTSAACVAELFEGHGREVQNFLYVFVGTFVGGGLVLGGQMVNGARGNAGAIGSLPMARVSGAEPRPAQLLSVASGWQLERALAAAGHDAQLGAQAAILAPELASVVQPWLQEAASGLAMSTVSATALMDVDAVVMDGSIHGDLLAALMQHTEAHMDSYRWEGLRRPALLRGRVGAHARALGGALLPLHAQYFPSQDVFLKT